MNQLISDVVAVFYTILLLLGGSYTIKEVHDAVRAEVLQTISGGLSSSEELANALTVEDLGF